jgi:HlyD family secretion protein
MSDILAWMTGLIALVVPGFGVSEPPQWNGYVEANYVYVSAPGPGPITAMPAQDGATVNSGDVLFVLDNRQQQAALDAAKAQVDVAQANVDNLATGSRTAEIDVIRASLDKAQADLALARSQSERTDQLLTQGLVPQAKADQDSATLKSAAAQVAQLDAQLRVAELPARDPQRIGAEASLLVAQANADKARVDLSDRTIVAPVAARIERVFFAQGEIIAAGTPVVALLPAGALKIKFYLPETDRPAFELGQRLQVTCDGCAAGLTATVSYFASEPQFTPPVIYSRDERNRLTFLVEARLDGSSTLPPGQPVTIAK